MRPLLVVILVVSIVAAGAIGAWIMVRNRPEPERQIPDVPAPPVHVRAVEPIDLRLTVSSQGTVVPRTESTLVAEVAGRVVEVSPAFVAGGFFEEGETLLRIDPHDYHLAEAQAEAHLATARLRLAHEEAEAEVALREWAELDGGEAPPLTRREPQLAEARASLAAAEAGLAQARRNLERTRIVAPFAGRVRRKEADLGQFVGPGTPLGVVYAVDYAEVRLPLPPDDLAFVDLPLDYRGTNGRGAKPRVILRAQFAGARHEWEGTIVRTEGEIDPRSRMVHAVARVPDPYGRGGAAGRPPLAVGMYVEAEIVGRHERGVFVVPRSTLRDGDSVLIVDAEDRLRFREVEVVRAHGDEAIVRSGLSAGDRLCLTPLAVATEGMRVRVEPDGPVAPGAEPPPAEESP